MSVVALKQKPKAPSFGEALAQTAKAEPQAAKKATMPTLQAPPEVAVYRAVPPEQLPALRTFARQYKPSIR
jgi:hypothetical protein